MKAIFVFVWRPCKFFLEAIQRSAMLSSELIQTGSLCIIKLLQSRIFNIACSRNIIVIEGKLFILDIFMH